MKDCTSCPSFLGDTPEDAAEIRSRFRRPLGAPMCGRFGYVLGFSANEDGTSRQHPEDRSNMLQAIAADCAAYGEPRPARPVSRNPRVALPDELIMAEGPSGMEVGSCHGCRNLVKHPAVHEAFGWVLPICKAKGTLVYDGTEEATDCAWARPGMPTADTSGITLRPEFQPGFRVNAAKAFESLVANGKLNVEPSTYETDEPVEDDDKAVGIRAWREIVCPFGTGKIIHLPIFDRSAFTAQQQQAIPQTGDAHHPELYIDYGNLLWRFCVDEWKLDNTLFIQSDPGLGKTEFTYWLAWLMQVPWTRIICNDRMEPDEPFGKMLFENNETVFQNGRFTDAIEFPAGIICLDEPNTAPSEIVQTFRTTAELDRVLILDTGIAEVDEHGNRHLQKLVRHINPYCFVVWCGNPSWDARNIGTKEMAVADVSRLSPCILETPPESVERQIIKTTLKTLDDYDIPDDLLTDLLKVSADIREMAKPSVGEFPGTWGIRENVKVGRKLAWYSFTEAFLMGGLNYYEPDTRNFIVTKSIQTVRDE